jgi:Rrf2 family nitric oxide-sensitive transcriptional repressor
MTALFINGAILVMSAAVFHGSGHESVADISDAYGISKHHLVRVAQTLGEHGYVELIPGRAGGLRLAMDPAAIRLGDVVRRTEPHLRLVECFDAATNTCPIIEHCGLRLQLHKAVEAFVASLNEHTLGDLLSPRRRGQFSEVFIRTQDLLRSRTKDAAARAPRDARRRLRTQPERS